MLTKGIFVLSKDTFASKNERIKEILERREKGKDNVRMLILESARSLFFANGFKDVAVNEIAQLSGRAKVQYDFTLTVKKKIMFKHCCMRSRYFTGKPLIKRKQQLISYSNISDNIQMFFSTPALFRIMMALMLQVDQASLSEAQHENIAADTRKYIDVIGYMLQYDVNHNEFPSAVDVKYNNFIFWRMLKNIIVLHIFTDLENKRLKIKSILQEFKST